MAELREQLSVEEEIQLDHCDGILDQNERNDFERDKALREIRDKRLYRPDYASFEDYCRSGGI
jgi:hypothetical protein